MLDALVADARTRWGLDLAAGLQLVAVERLITTPIEASRPLIVAPLERLGGGAAIGSSRPLAGRHGPAGRHPIDVLRRLYPDGHPVAYLGADGATTVGALAPTGLGRGPYLAPVAAELAAAGPWSMPYISARLREPDGCPWDREQTHESLRKHLLEETYEVYDALEHGATPALAEELGDLLLQVVLHAQLAAEAGVFPLPAGPASIPPKIGRRHPPRFWDAGPPTAAGVPRPSGRIQREERGGARRQSAGDG